MLSFFLAVVAQLAGRRPDEESELLARIQNADQAALRALYERLAAQALAIALRVLGVRVEAEEVVQDVFVEVWRRSGQYDGSRGSGRAWVLSMVRNRAIDHLRSRGATYRLHGRVANEERGQPLTVVDPLEDAQTRQTRVLVQRALDELTQEQRRAIELAYFEGLSQSEIATKLGEPLGTIKSRVRAGMEKLARLLPDEAVLS